MTYFCTICGGELRPMATLAACSFCGQQTPAKYLCAAGHHICEECQLAEWPQVVERVCEGLARDRPSGHREPDHAAPHVGHAQPAAPHPGEPGGAGGAEEQRADPGEHGRGSLRRSSAPRVFPWPRADSAGNAAPAIGVGALVSILTGATYLKDRERSLDPTGFRRGAHRHRPGWRSALLQTERLPGVGDGFRFPQARDGDGSAGGASLWFLRAQR